MIEGLKVTVVGTELKTLCENRAKFNDDRCAFYEKQKLALPDIDENVPSFTNSSKRPQEMMQERINNHKAEAAELRFIAEHLQTVENYLLSRSDLHKLGIATGQY